MPNSTPESRRRAGRPRHGASLDQVFASEAALYRGLQAKELKRYYAWKMVEEQETKLGTEERKQAKLPPLN